LENICAELNNPVLKRICSWRNNSRNWKYVTNQTARDGCLNGIGFIYDANYCDLSANLSKEILLSGCDNKDTVDNNTVEQIPPPPTAYLAAFKLSKWTCYVLNIYLKYFNLDNIQNIVKELTQQLENDERVTGPGDILPKIDNIYLVCGDFTGLENGNNIMNTYFYGNNSSIQQQQQQQHSKANQLNFNLENIGFYNLVDTNYVHTTQATPATVLPPPTSLPASFCNILCRDNLPLNKLEFRKKLYEVQSHTDILNSNNICVPSMETKLTGSTGVIRTGLSHMAIPKFWGWGGPVSDSYPVWCELYSEIDRMVSYKALTDSDKNAEQIVLEEKPISLTSCGALTIPNGHVKCDSLQLSVVQPIASNGSMKF
jgi:hypothetical protein